MFIVHQIHVKKGEILRVRKWDDMKKDLRVSADRDGELTEIRPAGEGLYSFTNYMKKYCGQAVVVVIVEENGVLHVSPLDFEDETIGGFQFREWMLERCE